jgi:hypothetical protein
LRLRRNLKRTFVVGVVASSLALIVGLEGSDEVYSDFKFNPSGTVGLESESFEGMTEVLPRIFCGW